MAVRVKVRLYAGPPRSEPKTNVRVLTMVVAAPSNLLSLSRTQVVHAGYRRQVENTGVTHLQGLCMPRHSLQCRQYIIIHAAQSPQSSIV